MASIRFSVSSSSSYSPQKLPPKEQNKDRLLKIQQKLQTITIQRHNQIKEDAQELITKRVLQLQAKTLDDMKVMDNQVHNLRQQLSQLKVRENQQTKKYQICRKNRQIQISELQKKIVSMMSFETKDRKDRQNGLAKNVEEKTQNVAKELNELDKKRIADANCVEQNLRRDLPTTNFAIQGSYAQVQNKLEGLHKEVRIKTGKIKENIENEEEGRELGFKKVMELLNTVVQQIKKDLQNERKSHQESKEKLISLFASASQNLNYK